MEAAHLLGRLARPVLVISADLAVRFGNEAFGRLLGADTSTEGLTALLRAEGSLLVPLAKALARLRIAGRATEFHWTAPGDDLLTYRVEVTCAGEGEYVALFDLVTEQVTLEEIQGETRSYLEAVLNHLDLGIVVLDRRFCVTFVNRPQVPLLALLGVELPVVDLIGAPVADCVPLLPLEQWAGVHTRVIERREPVTFEKLGFPARAPQRYFHVRIMPLSLGGAPGGICITEDITHLVSLEAALVEKERLALVGQMAIALNHEINNPLMVVIGNAEALLLSPALDAAAAESLQAIVDAGQRIAKVTRRLRQIEQIQLTEYVKNGPMMLDLRLLDES